MDDKEIVLKAEMYVKPDVTIEGYKGIEASVVLAPVTDEEIDREVDTVRERNAREIEITDRPAEMGDTAVIEMCIRDSRKQGAFNRAYRQKDIGSGP